jgi:hypothetical protein
VSLLVLVAESGKAAIRRPVPPLAAARTGWLRPDLASFNETVFAEAGRREFMAVGAVNASTDTAAAARPAAASIFLRNISPNPYMSKKKIPRNLSPFSYSAANKHTNLNDKPSV